MPNTELKVVDMPMGTGKTTGMIHFMNTFSDRQYLFVTPYKTERERIQTECPALDFHIPTNERSRLDECHRFIKQGKNIATTHALFSYFNPETMDLLSRQHYTLIIDEEPDCIFDTLVVPQEDFHMLKSENYFKVSETNKQLQLNPEREYTGSIAGFSELYKLCDRHSFYLVDDLTAEPNRIGIIGVMNPEIFNCFDEIFILTYLFADSNYDCYCRFCRIPYAYYHIADNTLCEGKFDDTAFREQCKSLIRLYSGRLNFRPPVERNQRAVTLSKSFYQNASTQMLSRVKCNVSNFIRNICHGRQTDTLWSTYADYKSTIQGGGCYSKSFVSCNCRATNAYRDRRILAYLLNLSPHPYLVRWLLHNNIDVNLKHFPLTMLLQWIFRSQIRDGKPIELYLPSARMREILSGYLAGEIC